MATNNINLLLLLSILCLCSTRDVYIQPSEGEHCPDTCYNINTLGKMAISFSNSSGLVVHFLEGIHLLDLQELVVFTNLTNAVFEGDGRMEQGFHETVWQSTVVIKCTEHSSTGIAFVNSSNITFKYITITNCGADMTGFCLSNTICNGSLGYFKMSHKIAIDHVSIQNGTGNGLLIESNGVDLMITDSSFAQNYIYQYVDGGNIAIVYVDPHTCDPQSYEYNMFILNTNASFGDGEFKIIDGILIDLFQGSYSVAIVLDSVIAYRNKGYANIRIGAAEQGVPTYSLTINNLLSFGANSYALSIISTTKRDNHKQCSITQETLLDFNINIVNSKFTKNNNKDDDAIVSISLLGVKFTTRIFIQATEMSLNVGTPGLELNLFSNRYQSQFFVTLLNFTAKNNSCLNLYSDNIIPSTIYANFVTTLVLKNVSITNNNMAGLNA